MKQIGTSWDRTNRNIMNENFTEADRKVLEQKQRVDRLIQDSPQPSEVVDARGEHAVLGDRLNEVDTQLTKTEREIGDKDTLPEWLQLSIREVSKMHDDYLRQVAINVKTPPYNAKGDGISDDTEAIQKAFDYAKDTGADVFIPKGTFLVNATGLTYKNNNSTLIFNGELKLKDGGISSLYVLRFEGENITVKNINIDGDRDNNLINTTNRGTQFNFSISSNSKNIIFVGGNSNNALQSQLQSSGENIIFDGLNLDNSGEHGFYLTLQLSTNTAKRKVTVKNCKVTNWGRDWDAMGISLRDYYFAHIDNCDIEPIESGYAAIQNWGDYGSNADAEEKMHLITNCKLHGLTESTITEGTIITRFVNCHVNHKVTAKNPNNQTEMVNCYSTYHKPYTYWRYLPKKVIDCTFYGMEEIRPDHVGVFKGCHVYYRNTVARQRFIALDEQATFTGNGLMMEDCYFYDFPSTSQGIIRTRTGIRSTIKNCKFINCGTARATNSVSTNDIIEGNVDVSMSGVTHLTKV